MVPYEFQAVWDWMLDIKKKKKKISDSVEDCNFHPQWETWDFLYIPECDKSGMGGKLPQIDVDCKEHD